MVNSLPVRLRKFMLILLGTVVIACTAGFDSSESESKDSKIFNGQLMTAKRMGELIRNVDPTAVQEGTTWKFKVAELDTMVVFDEGADRMRIIIPIGKASDLQSDELMRLMQANFDSALDARYAIGQGLLWGTFIHPLSTLTDEEFLVGLGQTANVVASFGASYSSGMFIFGGGDSADIERQKLIEKLKKQTT